jgi:hypothetical protein
MFTNPIEKRITYLRYCIIRTSQAQQFNTHDL